MYILIYVHTHKYNLLNLLLLIRCSFEFYLIHPTLELFEDVKIFLIILIIP